MKKVWVYNDGVSGMPSAIHVGEKPAARALIPSGEWVEMILLAPIEFEQLGHQKIECRCPKAYSKDSSACGRAQCAAARSPFAGVSCDCDCHVARPRSTCNCCGGALSNGNCFNTGCDSNALAIQNAIKPGYIE